MRVRTAVFLTSCVLFLAACDKVYFARIDVGPYRSTEAGIPPLTSAEREHAASVFRATAGELGLRCTPNKYPEVTDSYDLSRYRLARCRAEGHFTTVQFAESPTHVSVEIHEIGGIGEPTFFRKCRTRLTEAFAGAFPSNRLTVRYPYHWGAVPSRAR